MLNVNTNKKTDIPTTSIPTMDEPNVELRSMTSNYTISKLVFRYCFRLSIISSNLFNSGMIVVFFDV